MKTKKLTHILSTGMIATTLIFSAGAGQAFANEDGAQTTETSVIEETTATETGETVVDLTPVSEEAASEGTEPVVEEGTDAEPISEEESGEPEVIDLGGEGTEDTAEVDEEAPTLIPGDFFYFVKVMAEKVRLAFTFDDYKEAKLIAEFAAERISEANALIADGKTAEAEELLKEAIATQEQAEETLPETEEATSEETVAEETAVESKLAHNIDSLLVVLAKVENPKAQQAIMKNLQKSFEHLEKKSGKLAKKKAKFADKMKELEEKVNDGQISEEDAAEEQSNLDEDLAKDELEVVEEAAKDAAEVEKEAAENQQEAAVKAQEKQQKAA
ncbi:DUF5667 domain-containing protein, partial [Neobacillus niacini]|uniref:DUF5667 domain-containing protein n=1 Tax=Neobacillus niacini TaxID=86668 RepID=UPI002FFD97E6